MHAHTMGVHINRSIESKRGCHIVRFPVAGVTGSCELSSISAGN